MVITQSLSLEEDTCKTVGRRGRFRLGAGATNETGIINRDSHNQPEKWHNKINVKHSKRFSVRQLTCKDYKLVWHLYGQIKSLPTDCVIAKGTKFANMLAGR